MEVDVADEDDADDRRLGDVRSFVADVMTLLILLDLDAEDARNSGFDVVVVVDVVEGGDDECGEELWRFTLDRRRVSRANVDEGGRD